MTSLQILSSSGKVVSLGNFKFGVVIEVISIYIVCPVFPVFLLPGSIIMACY